MPTVVTVHSYRGGTGKSDTAATIALLAAAAGRRTALIDTDIPSPCAHLLLDLEDVTGHRSLADYLLGRCEIEEAAVPVAGVGPAELFVVPARCGPDEVNEIMARGYDVGLLREGFDRLVGRLGLDTLVLDTRTGMSNETISALTGSDVVVVVTRADCMGAEAREATAFANWFAKARRMVVVNMLPPGEPAGPVRAEAEEAFEAPVVAVIPYYPDIASRGGGLFAREHPDHHAVADYRVIAEAALTGKE